jgi:subtilisin family serine protease
VSIADITGSTSTATGWGTAYSAGIVAAIAAQVLHANPSWTPAQVWTKISALAVSGKITGARSANKLAGVGSTYDSFVKASFQDFLGRQPTSSELAVQSNALSSGTVSVSSYLDTLSRSDEWLSAIVTKMYQDTLQRGPDPAGLAGWVAALKSGQWSVAQVASFFYASDEYYYSVYAGTAESWVTLLYQKLLNRDPDPLGLAYWVQQTNDPQYGRSWVAYNFYQSQESRTRRVEALYQALLFREPDPTGWPFWTGTVLSTGDLVLATQIAGSQEYWDKAHVRY